MLGVSGIVPRILYAGQPISIMKSLIHTALNMWSLLPRCWANFISPMTAHLNLNISLNRKVSQIYHEDTDRN